jgi:hypothetical protein
MYDFNLIKVYCDIKVTKRKIYLNLMKIWNIDLRKSARKRKRKRNNGIKSFLSCGICYKPILTVAILTLIV